MNQFTSKYAESIGSVLSGFDRVLLRGTLRRLSFVEGMMAYLHQHRLLIKEFGSHSEHLTARVKEASLTPVRALGRPVIHLDSPKVSKEEIAQRIATEDGVTEGPVCVLTSVEPCYSFQVYRNRESKEIELVSRRRKCLHLYHYMVHPKFGFMHARIATWFPFGIHVCLNGREWLARQMAAEGLGFGRIDNCFVRLDSPERAQELMGSQLKVDWAAELKDIARTLNPLHEELFGSFCADYYWSALQSEWATDILFTSPGVLRGLYPKLVRHGVTSLSSPDVMRFLGRKPSPRGSFPGNYEGEVSSDIKKREEGVRIKHRVGSNSVKAYDKAYTKDAAVLRVETTMNDETGFKVYRRKEGEKDGPLEWRCLRRGVADMHRRAQVSQACNERYLDALACADTTTTLQELAGRVTRQARWKGKSVRALHPFDQDDSNLLELVSRGEFTINGLRNRDLRALLFGTESKATAKEVRRRSARVTRLLRMLRAHRILAKVSGTHRYQITKFGRQLTTAVVAARQTLISRFLEAA